MYKAWDYRCADIKLVWGPPGMQLFYVSHSPGISLLLCVNSLTGARIITGVLNFCAGSSGPHLSLQVSWLQRPSLWPASLAPFAPACFFVDLAVLCFFADFAVPCILLPFQKACAV